MEDLIGKRVEGFSFELEYPNDYVSEMDEYIGVEGTIEKVNEDGYCRVGFEDGEYWHYPVEFINEHLIP